MSDRDPDALDEAEPLLPFRSPYEESHRVPTTATDCLRCKSRESKYGIGNSSSSAVSTYTSTDGWQMITLNPILPRKLVSNRFVIGEKENRKRSPAENPPLQTAIVRN